MRSLKLIKTKMYLHNTKESNYQQGEELGLSEKAMENFKYALYEVEFVVEINEDSGEVEIIAVDGKKLIKTTVEEFEID